jgi:hypothetical protein
MVVGGGGVWRPVEAGGFSCVVRGATGSRAGPFIGVGRRFGGGDIPPATGSGGAASRSVQEESLRGRRGSVRDSQCGVVGYDPSCR